VISVETNAATDAGEYEMEVFYSSKNYPPAMKGPTTTQKIKIIVTSIATASSNLYPYLVPKPDSEYKIKVGQRFKWEFKYKDPENDAVKVSIILRNGTIKRCGCSKLTKDPQGVWTWDFTPNKKMAGQQIIVAVTLADPINTATTSFTVRV